MRAMLGDITGAGPKRSTVSEGEKGVLGRRCTWVSCARTVRAVVIQSTSDESDLFNCWPPTRPASALRPPNRNVPLCLAAYGTTSVPVKTRRCTRQRPCLAPRQSRRRCLQGAEAGSAFVLIQNDHERQMEVIISKDTFVTSRNAIRHFWDERRALVAR